MARPLRIEFPGAVYHVTSRGNARTDIFEDDNDRHLFLSILGQTVKRKKCGTDLIKHYSKGGQLAAFSVSVTI